MVGVLQGMGASWPTSFGGGFAAGGGLLAIWATRAATVGPSESWRTSKERGDRDVIMVEDIVDTGMTLNYM